MRINNAESFALYIEAQVRTKHLSYMDAILHFCAEHKLEPESITSFITEKMKAALAREGLALNLLNKSKMDDGLPLDFA